MSNEANRDRPVQEAGSARILIVDDEPSNLRLLDAMLRREGYADLVLIEDPRQVLAHYRQKPADLILLDLNMPHLDGYAVMEQLRALGDPLLPPVLVLTAQHGREYLLRALAAGARDFVAKPFDRVELLMRVRNLLDAHLAHSMVHSQRDILAEMVRQRTEALQRSRLEVVQRLGRAAEYRDEETGNHILRMSHTAALLAHAAGWDKTQCELLLHAAAMHDIGKIGIPDHILLKPGTLSPDEWEVMKMHTEIGARILEGGDSELLEMGRVVALSHHEQWRGTGYPRGLVGEAIPQAGRICALADVFDALISDRPYKRAWSVASAVEYIRDQTGKHFDPELSRLFLDLLPQVLEIRTRFSEGVAESHTAYEPAAGPGN